LALQDALEKQGVYTRVQSAIEMNQVCRAFLFVGAPSVIWKKGPRGDLCWGHGQSRISPLILPLRCAPWKFKQTSS